MSALRVRTPDGGVQLVDPHTRQAYRPVLFTWNHVSEPVVVQPPVRPATAHARPPQRPPRPKGLYLSHLDDATVLAAVTGRSQADAAVLLRCSQSSIARRLRQIRAGVAA